MGRFLFAQSLGAVDSLQSGSRMVWPWPQICCVRHLLAAKVVAGVERGCSKMVHWCSVCCGLRYGRRWLQAD